MKFIAFFMVWKLVFSQTLFAINDFSVYFRYVKERQKKIMIKARNSRDLPVTDNPFHNMETLKKYGRYNGDDSGFVDAEVDDNEIQSK